MSWEGEDEESHGAMLLFGEPHHHQRQHSHCSVWLFLPRYYSRHRISSSNPSSQPVRQAAALDGSPGRVSGGVLGHFDSGYCRTVWYCRGMRRSHRLDRQCRVYSWSRNEGWLGRRGGRVAALVLRIQGVLFEPKELEDITRLGGLEILHTLRCGC